MFEHRTEAARQLAELLRTARQSLGLGFAFLTRMNGTTQHLEAVDSASAEGFQPGMSHPQESSFCQAIMNGRLPPVMADVTAYPEAMRLPGAKVPLRARGMRLAVDDVGAGFSSLRHIVLTAPDVIKLDRSIVTGIGDDPVLSVVTQSLVDLARATGAAVVAEGVETEADAAALTAAGVGFGQGRLFGKATTPEELREHYGMAVRS